MLTLVGMQLIDRAALHLFLNNKIEMQLITLNKDLKVSSQYDKNEPTSKTIRLIIARLVWLIDSLVFTEPSKSLKLI
jgi:hypothetical protein